ncbi:MAG: hypothetical protein ACOCZ6_05690 [Nanoarchaeota archaeon]
MLRRERPEPEGRASHRSVTDGGRGLLTKKLNLLQIRDLCHEYKRVHGIS